MWVIPNGKGLKGFGGTPDMVGIDGMMGCKSMLADAVGVHGGISNINGPV